MHGTNVFKKGQVVNSSPVPQSISPNITPRTTPESHFFLKHFQPFPTSLQRSPTPISFFIATSPQDTCGFSSMSFFISRKLKSVTRSFTKERRQDLLSRSSTNMPGTGPRIQCNMERDPQLQRNTELNGHLPLCRLPAELKSMILAHCSPSDGINLARTCSAFGTWASTEVFRLDSCFGDRRALSHACTTNDDALLRRALEIGASANDVFPLSRGMSGLNPLALALTHHCSTLFVHSLLLWGNITPEALNSSTSGQNDPMNEHFWTDTPLQMALLRALPQANDPYHNPKWHVDYARVQVWYSPAGGNVITNKRLVSAAQDKAIQEAVCIATMLIYAGARTTNPQSPPPGPRNEDERPTCGVLHLRAQYDYHHHREEFLSHRPGFRVMHTFRGPSFEHLEGIYLPEPYRLRTRTPVYLALRLTELDHGAVFPLLSLMLERMGDTSVAKNCFLQDPFRACLGMVMCCRGVALQTVRHDYYASEDDTKKVAAMEDLKDLWRQYEITYPPF